MIPRPRACSADLVEKTLVKNLKRFSRGYVVSVSTHNNTYVNMKENKIIMDEELVTELWKDGAGTRNDRLRKEKKRI